MNDDDDEDDEVDVAMRGVRFPEGGGRFLMGEVSLYFMCRTEVAALATASAITGVPHLQENCGTGGCRAAGGGVA